MKRTIEIDDTLQDRVAFAIADVRELLITYLANNPDVTETPCLHNDLDYDGSVHEIVDLSVPVYHHEIDTMFFLHGNRIENAFENAGFGSKDDEQWPNGWKAAAVYSFIMEEVCEWYSDHADDIVAQYRADQKEVSK